MQKEQKFFLCKHCGNLVGLVDNAGIPMSCCGEKMAELTPNTVDAAQEKHLPVVRVSGSEVSVEIGSVAHPMQSEHHIAWVYVQTEHGGQRKNLDVSAEPRVRFALTGGDRAAAVFAYCNLHGLWKADC